MILDLTILVAVIVGITQVLKLVGVPTRFAPLTALVVGVALNFLFKVVGVEWGQVLFTGLVAGLTACGAWSATKTTLDK